MKILITENQLNRILLSEEVERKRLYTDPNIVISVTEFDTSINAVNPTGIHKGRKYAIGTISNLSKKLITFSIVENNSPGIKDIFLYGVNPKIQKINIKPRSAVKFVFIFEGDKSGITTESLSFSYTSQGTREVTKTLRIPVKITSTQEINNQIMSSCRKIINKDVLNSAINWWKNWLNNRATKDRFAKTWKYNNDVVEKHFREYQKILSQIKLNYTYEDRNSAAWVYTLFKKGYNIPVNINCRLIGDNNKDYVNNLLIHEIQHILDSYHKFHPYADDIFTYYKNMFSDFISSTPKVNDIELKKFLKSNGFGDNVIEKIIRDYKWRLENDISHLKDPNEVMSTLTQVRRIMGIRPDQKITKELLIRYSNNKGLSIFISQWLYSKKSLSEFLNFSNSIAMNKDNTDYRALA